MGPMGNELGVARARQGAHARAASCPQVGLACASSEYCAGWESDLLRLIGAEAGICYDWQANTLSVSLSLSVPLPLCLSLEICVYIHVYTYTHVVRTDLFLRVAV